MVAAADAFSMGPAVPNMRARAGALALRASEEPSVNRRHFTQVVAGASLAGLAQISTPEPAGAFDLRQMITGEVGKSTTHFLSRLTYALLPTAQHDSLILRVIQIDYVRTSMGYTSLSNTQYIYICEHRDTHFMVVSKQSKLKRRCIYIYGIFFLAQRARSVRL